MDMVNDGKDTRLDTPQTVKEALTTREASPIHISISTTRTCWR